MAATDHPDFSFPTLTDPLSSSIDSPPFWRLSPVASPFHEKSSYQEAKDLKECVESRLNIKCTQRKEDDDDNDGDEEEEKMDILWEDFNEEMLTRSKSRRGESERILEVGYVHQTSRLSKTSGAVFSSRTTGLVELVRVMKRLLLFHNSHRPLKNHSSHKKSKRNLSW